MQYGRPDATLVELATIDLVLVGHGVTLEPRHFVPQMRTCQRFAGHGVLSSNWKPVGLYYAPRPDAKDSIFIPTGMGLFQ